MSENPFDTEVIDAVAHHMNADHRDDALLIVRAFGGVPDATSATVSYLDGSGVDFSVVDDTGERTVRVPWSRPLTERPEIRREFVRLYEDATLQLDVEPRPAEPH